MNKISRTTHSCTIDDLDAGLRAKMRAHISQYGLGAIESDVLFCCETISVRQKRSPFGTKTETTVSAAYVTPKWLLWADSTDRNDAGVGSAQLARIDVHNYETTAMYAIAPDHGINVTGRYTDKNKTGMTFIVLGPDSGGQSFRKILEEAMRKVISSSTYSPLLIDDLTNPVRFVK